MIQLDNVEQTCYFSFIIHENFQNKSHKLRINTIRLALPFNSDEQRQTSNKLLIQKYLFYFRLTKIKYEERIFPSINEQ